MNYDRFTAAYDACYDQATGLTQEIEKHGQRLQGCDLSKGPEAVHASFRTKAVEWARLVEESSSLDQLVFSHAEEMRDLVQKFTVAEMKRARIFDDQMHMRMAAFALFDQQKAGFMKWPKFGDGGQPIWKVGRYIPRYVASHEHPRIFCGKQLPDNYATDENLFSQSIDDPFLLNWCTFLGDIRTRPLEVQSSTGPVRMDLPENKGKACLVTAIIKYVVVPARAREGQKGCPEKAQVVLIPVQRSQLDYTALMERVLYAFFTEFRVALRDVGGWGTPRYEKSEDVCADKAYMGVDSCPLPTTESIESATSLLVNKYAPKGGS